VDAARGGDVTTAAKLLNAGADVNTTYGDVNEVCLSLPVYNTFFHSFN